MRLQVMALWISTAIAGQAQTFTVLASFDPQNDGGPNTALVQGVDGGLYGTTYEPGHHGAVFVLTTEGQLTLLHSLSETEGDSPQGLTLTADGTLYGTAVYGGANSDGTIFAITPVGTFTILHTFDFTDGRLPNPGLAQGFNGMLYGTTHAGGSYQGGTIFEITTGGTFTNLYNFNVRQQIAYPLGGLVQSSNGLLYGATVRGGTYGNGTIFAAGLDGVPTTVDSLQYVDGGGPQAAMIQATDGNFYGTSLYGGANGVGTVFRMTPGGTLTIVHSFDTTDGSEPYGGVIEGTDGSLYGTTVSGGTNGWGTIFRVTPAGDFATLHFFDFTDGMAPYGGLMQATDGNFYGTAQGGGGHGAGDVFRLSMGLAPFVKTVPAFGAEGAAVTILGTDLAGATSVTFNGQPAAFSVIGSTAIHTTVPSGASSGSVVVVTPGGTLSSNVPFQLLDSAP